MKTIKDLKKAIEHLDDDMVIGASGHFGEFLECYWFNVQKVSKSRSDSKKETIFAISMQDAGEEPD